MTSAALLGAFGLAVRVSGKTLLGGVSLEVLGGQVVGVFGPSGAGKTTLFRVLAGEIAPAEGRVHMAGRDVTRLPLWERARCGLGYLPQTPSVLPDLSVRQNLAVFDELARAWREGERASAFDIAKDLGLEPLFEARAARLSGGERRRLELARALSASPRVLVCDEPFAAVDPLGAARVGDRLRALADAGASVLVADHHVEAALRLCDRALLLLEGEIVLDDTPARFRDHPLVRERYAAQEPFSIRENPRAPNPVAPSGPKLPA
jgi:lipopolysaccharide export system ATP-binding protein